MRGDDMELLVPILTGGAAVAVIKIMDNVLMWLLNRKAKLNDDGKNAEAERLKRLEDELEKLAEGFQILKNALRVNSHDRIKYLGRKHIENGEVSFDDREDLIEMHDVYHNDLGGNGNLDNIMKQVMDLTLKK